jgi:lysine decarboxylase
MLTTTSTSYLLLASLDCARRHLAINGEAINRRPLELATRMRFGLAKLPYLAVFGESDLYLSATFAFDPTKVLVSVKGLGISGHHVEEFLREEHRIEVELSDLNNILVIITSGDSDETIDGFLHAMSLLVARYQNNGAEMIDHSIVLPDFPALELSPRDAS